MHKCHHWVHFGNSMKLVPCLVSHRANSSAICFHKSRLKAKDALKPAQDTDVGVALNGSDSVRADETSRMSSSSAGDICSVKLDVFY